MEQEENSRIWLSIVRKVLPSDSYLFAVSEIVAAAGLVWVLAVVDQAVLGWLERTAFVTARHDPPTVGEILYRIEEGALVSVTVVGAISAFILSLGGLAQILRRTFPRLFPPRLAPPPDRP
jgi:hypothetical protein